MMLLGMSKKTIAILLCISSVSVMFILNAQLKSAPRRARFESRHALSVPLTLDLSKNITFLRLPDANNEFHRYKLERIKDEDDEEEEADIQKHMQPSRGHQTLTRGKTTATDDAEDEFGDRLDEDEEFDGKGSRDPAKVPSTKEKSPADHPGVVVTHKVQPAPNLTKQVQNVQEKINYLLRVSDPRYPRMIGRILAKLPGEVRKDMTMAIRKAEAKAKISFQKQPIAKQWEVILKVFRSRGYTQRFPDVINIGVKKSGTNALGFFLPEHPQIVHSIGNEVHFFDWMYDKGIDYYKSRMGFAKQDQLQFEKTPRYFVTYEVPARIKRDLPTNPKFILCVRDPISRLISDFRHESELHLRKEFKRDRLKYSLRTPQFEGQRLKREILDSRGRVNASNELVSTSVYAKHFKNWLSHFPPERILVVDQDRMEKNVYTQMKRLEEFLGLKSFFKPSMFYTDERIHGTCLHQVHHSLRNCPAKSTPSVLPKAEIDPETLRKLKDFYRPLNREFAKLTGMEFSWAN